MRLRTFFTRKSEAFELKLAEARWAHLWSKNHEESSELAAADPYRVVIVAMLWFEVGADGRHRCLLDAL